jgi:hypothetical protein
VLWRVRLVLIRFFRNLSKSFQGPCKVLYDVLAIRDKSWLSDGYYGIICGTD